MDFIPAGSVRWLVGDRRMRSLWSLWFLWMSVSIAVVLLLGCGSGAAVSPGTAERTDGAYRLEIDLPGSLQNPAFSPDGNALVFTRFRDGYNTGASDLFIYDLETGALRALVSDGNGNVNLPGAAWDGVSDRVVFSSARDPHDEIFVITATGQTGDEVQITDRADRQAYEATFSPDGQWIVFESHAVDVEDDGVVTKYRVDGRSAYIPLTPATDNCKQPNWSPAGDRILYQKEEGGRWAIWTMNTDGSDRRPVTGADESGTDAIFSPDGRWIIYSSENEAVELANIYKIPAEGGTPVRITHYSGYDGAPSISPDGRRIAFESSAGYPEGSAGTSLWLIDVPMEEDPRSYQHGIDFVPLPEGDYALIWASSGNPPTGQLPNGDWTHDIYYSHIVTAHPVISPVLLISNPEAQEPASAASTVDGHIMVTMEDGWNTSRTIAQRYGVYDAGLDPLLSYPQMVADGGHSGHVASTGARFVVFYSEGWVDGGGVDDLGSGDDVWAAVYSSTGELEHTLAVAVGDSSRDWWPLVAGAPGQALLVWQRFVENETYSRLLFALLDVESATLDDETVLEEPVRYYTYDVAFVAALDRFLVVGAHPDGTGFAHLLDREGNVTATATGLPEPVREAQVVLRQGEGEVLATVPLSPTGMMVLTLTPDSVRLKYTLAGDYRWSYSGTDGIFLSSATVYIVATSPAGLVERVFSLPSGEGVYLPLVFSEAGGRNG